MASGYGAFVYIVYWQYRLLGGRQRQISTETVRNLYRNCAAAVVSARKSNVWLPCSLPGDGALTV